jgi:hypothetical protein
MFLIRKISYLFLALILASCGSGGGKSSDSINPQNPPIIDTTIPDYEPSCSEPENPEHKPFHNKGVKSEIEYYLICNANQLKSINNSSETLSYNYRMGQDIDLYSYYEGDYIVGPTNQFTIGSINNPFKGIFIGDHWSISNYRYINSENNTYCGLFSFIEDANVNGIQLENARIENRSDSSVCGSIIGSAKNSLIYEIAVVKEEEIGVDERDWAFVRGTNISGIVGKLLNTTLYESYSVIELQNVDLNSNNNFNISGLSHIIEEGSVLVDLFYDGKIEVVLGTNKAGVSINDIQGIESQPYVEAVYFSDKISENGCLNSNDCNGKDIYYIDTSIDQYYFMDSRNLPLSNWNSVNWWFADSVENAHYPFLD